MRITRGAHEKHGEWSSQKHFFYFMKSYAESINDAQLMSAGMQNNATEAAVRGWTIEKTGRLTAIRLETGSLNSEQECLKAELKMKTAQLDAKMAELRAMMKEAKKVVKLEFPQTQWKEFGVVDKH